MLTSFARLLSASTAWVPASAAAGVAAERGAQAADSAGKDAVALDVGDRLGLGERAWIFDHQHRDRLARRVGRRPDVRFRVAEKPDRFLRLGHVPHVRDDDPVAAERQDFLHS